MRLNGDVQLPANATARVGQTSLLGSLHVELAPPTGVAPEGRLHEGSLIPLSSGSSYPTTEQTLAAISLLLNGGGVGQIQDITKALATAFNGREGDLRSLIEQLDKFISYANDQKGDIISRHRESEQSRRPVRRAEARRGQGAQDDSGRPGGAQGSAQSTRRRAHPTRQVQRAGRRLGEPDERGPGSGTQGPRSGAAVAGGRGSGDDAGTELVPDVPVAQGNHRQHVPRRLRQPEPDLRSDAEPDRQRPVHRHALGG